MHNLQQTLRLTRSAAHTNGASGFLLDCWLTCRDGQPYCALCETTDMGINIRTCQVFSVRDSQAHESQAHLHRVIIVC